MNSVASRGSIQMREAILVGEGLLQNNIFNLLDEGNRDRCYEPYALLADVFCANGIVLKTPDMASADVVFELHINVRPAIQVDRPKYLMLHETPLICPANALLPVKYRKVFNWNDLLADGLQNMKFNFPSPLLHLEANGFVYRERFCCMIAGNMAPAQYDPRELYSERVRDIRWFERNVPQDFDLYGIDWNLPAARPRLSGNPIRRLSRHLSGRLRLQSFPSCRGKADRKLNVLYRTRFSICYENMRCMPSYITEKKLSHCFICWRRLRVLGGPQYCWPCAARLLYQPVVVCRCVRCIYVPQGDAPVNLPRLSAENCGLPQERWGQAFLFRGVCGDDRINDCSGY